MSRWENAPSLREIVKLCGVLVDLYCASYAKPPQAATLDIDDTCDVAHGHQQLSLFNAHYDERCFLPIHVYDTATGRPVAVILRPGKTPSGKEVRGHLRRIVRRIRAHWPTTKITIRGDGHYGRREVMDWCEDNGLDYVFGLSGNKSLAAAVEDAADDIRTRRALKQTLVLRGYTQTDYAAKSWGAERRVCARIEATELGLDIRYVVTNIAAGSAEHIPRSRENPKILWVDEAEVIRNRITKFQPVLGDSFAQERERRLGKLPICGISLVVREMLVHQAP